MLVSLHTQNRLNPGSSAPGDCSVPINLSQNFGTKATSGGYSIEAIGGVIPWTWYTVAAGRNDTFTMHGWIGGGTGVAVVEFTIPPGSYNASSMAGIVEDLIRNGVFGVDEPGSQLDFTYSDVLGKFVMELSVGGAVQAQNYLEFIPGASPAHEILGFSTRAPPFRINANDDPTPLPNVADMTHIDEVYVLLDWPGVKGYLSQAIGPDFDAASTGTFRPVVAIAQVPDTAAWGAKCQFQKTCRFISGQIPSTVTMTLIDHEGRVVDTNGANWSINLRVYDLPGIAKSENHVTTVRGDEPILSNAPDQPTVGDPPPRKRRVEHAMLNDGPPARRSGFSQPNPPLSLIGRQPRG